MVMCHNTDKDTALPAVSSYNEWDLLEEVIVGVIDGACVPSWHVTLEATMPAHQKVFFRTNGGKAFPADQVAAARKELEEFVHILQCEGVTVRRPDPVDFARPYQTLDWECAGGCYAAMPRDTLMVIGNEIIEAPMAWRSRYLEVNAYRRLIKDYFRKGALWTCAPKPQLSDDLYNHEYAESVNGGEARYAITEFEPTFDAADFVRCGRDIFCQRSHVTNGFGIEWLRRHLGDDYRLHVLDVTDAHAMHIDATFVPLAPGQAIVNRERLPRLPAMFAGWDVLEAPDSCIPAAHPMYMCSKWVSVNVLSLDEKRVIVERDELPLISVLKDWGFEPIPCAFRNFNTFGGSFHCATLDIRRRGALESYFPRL